MEEVESVRTESSGGDESPEKGSEPQAALEALPASSPEPPSALPPAADAPVIQVTSPKFLLTEHAGKSPCRAA